MRRRRRRRKMNEDSKYVEAVASNIC